MLSSQVPKTQFGMTKIHGVNDGKAVERHCYWFKSGAVTVGTDPMDIVVREMPQVLSELGEVLVDRLRNLANIGMEGCVLEHMNNCIIQLNTGKNFR